MAAHGSGSTTTCTFTSSYSTWDRKRFADCCATSKPFSFVFCDNCDPALDLARCSLCYGKFSSKLKRRLPEISSSMGAEPHLEPVMKALFQPATQSHAAMKASTNAAKSIASDASTCTAPNRPSYVAKIASARPRPSCLISTVRYTPVRIFWRRLSLSSHEMMSLFLPCACGTKSTVRAQLGSAMMASPSTQSPLLDPERAGAVHCIASRMLNDLPFVDLRHLCFWQPLQRRCGDSQQHRSGAVQ